MKNFSLIIVTLCLFIGLPVFSIEYQQTSDFYFRKIFTPAENELIKSFSKDSHSNDILFYNFQKLFETKIYEMNNKDVDEINEWYADDYDLRTVKIPKSYYVNHGVIVYKAEGGMDFRPNYLYLKNKYGKYISDEYKIWLDLQNDNTIKHTLDLSADNRRNRLLFLEDFINKYPNFIAINDAKKLLEQVANIYIGKFDYAQYDMFDANNNLKKEYKKSYTKFLKENKQSKYYNEVFVYYKQLKYNKFKGNKVDNIKYVNDWQKKIYIECYGYDYYDIPYSYLKELRKKIKQNWHQQKNSPFRTTTILAKFTKNGQLISIKVYKTSGSNTLDQEALLAVKESINLPFPISKNGAELYIHFDLQYCKIKFY